MTKKKKIIIIVIIALFIMIAAIFAWQTYKRISRIFESVGAPGASFKSPVEDLPQTNPFEGVKINPFEKAETNPFKDVYKNPFAE